jgi:hypothetical protein
MAEPEAQLRRAAVRWIHERSPTARLLYEMGLDHGRARADIVTLSPEELHGFELKSPSDRLDRLEEQVRLYSETMDRATLVVAPRHMAQALPLLPDWWGMVEATPSGLEEVRPSRFNWGSSSLTTARLLSRDEAMLKLRDLDRHRGLSRRTREHVFRRLAEVLTFEDLRTYVRLRLLQRPGWECTRPR